MVIQNDDIRANINFDDDYYNVTMHNEAVKIARDIILNKYMNVLDPLIDNYSNYTKTYKLYIDNNSLTEDNAKELIKFLESTQNTVLSYTEDLKDSLKEGLDTYFSKLRKPESKEDEDMDMKHEMKYETTH